VDVEQLKKFIADSRYCSETEKYAVACATGDLGRAPWRDSLAEAWAYLDREQRAAVKEYRRGVGLGPMLDGVNG
jgi:hypothetical protein